MRWARWGCAGFGGTLAGDTNAAALGNKNVKAHRAVRHVLRWQGDFGQPAFVSKQRLQRVTGLAQVGQAHGTIQPWL